MKKVLLTLGILAAVFTLYADKPTVESCKQEYLIACSGAKVDTENDYTRYCECTWRTVVRLKLSGEFDLDLKKEDFEKMWAQCGRLYPKP